MTDFRKSTVYQIYPRSFYDTNGDGFGDLKGVTAKLDYIKELGVDYIWMTPFFVSPQYDNGYDVEDYYNIDPRYGTMEDFEELSREAEKRGIKLMLDMVFNHTSRHHEWFQKALAGDEKYKNFYIFKKGKEDGSAPTNWESKFGGNAWEYVPVVLSRNLLENFFISVGKILFGDSCQTEYEDFENMFYYESQEEGYAFDFRDLEELYHYKEFESELLLAVKLGDEKATLNLLNREETRTDSVMVIRNEVRRSKNNAMCFNAVLRKTLESEQVHPITNLLMDNREMFHKKYHYK